MFILRSLWYWCISHGIAICAVSVVDNSWELSHFQKMAQKRSFPDRLRFASAFKLSQKLSLCTFFFNLRLEVLGRDWDTSYCFRLIKSECKSVEKKWEKRRLKRNIWWRKKTFSLHFILFLFLLSFQFCFIKVFYFSFSFFLFCSNAFPIYCLLNIFPLVLFLNILSFLYSP